MHAIQYMHSIGIAHRGIRLESLLLAKDGNNVKVRMVCVCEPKRQ